MWWANNVDDVFLSQELFLAVMVAVSECCVNCIDESSPNLLFHLPVPCCPEIDAVHETPHQNLNLYGKNEDPIMDVKTMTLSVNDWNFKDMAQYSQSYLINMQSKVPQSPCKSLGTRLPQAISWSIITIHVLVWSFMGYACPFCFHYSPPINIYVQLWNVSRRGLCTVFCQICHIQQLWLRQTLLLWMSITTFLPPDWMNSIIANP